MANKYLNDTGLSYFFNKLKTMFLTNVAYDSTNKKLTKTVNGTTTDIVTLSTMKTAMSLNNVANGAEVNQNAFSNVKVGSTTVAADSKTDTLELAAGSNVTLTPDATNDKVTIAATVPTKTSDLTNDSGYITIDDVPEGSAASTTTPKMDGTAAVGTETAFARGDHVHPSDTTKVDKVTGKGLSTNDFTTTLKNKLDGIAEGATVDDHKWNDVALTKTQANSGTTKYLPYLASTTATESKLVIAKSGTSAPGSVGGAPLYDADGWLYTSTLDSGADSSAVVNKATMNSAISSKANLASPTFTGTPKAPTATAGTKTTQIATTAFVDTAVTNAIAGITGISYQIVTELPATGATGVIYLIAHSHGTGDAYDEYIWTGTAFEKIGNTDVDLSDYMKTSDMVAITTSEIDTLFA